MQFLEDCIEKTPHGIFEMLKIKGIGPKKILLSGRKWGIENIGELLMHVMKTACFIIRVSGKKTQENVIESIEFYLSQQGSYLYGQVQQLATGLQDYFKKLFSRRRNKNRW